MVKNVIHNQEHKISVNKKEFLGSGNPITDQIRLGKFLIDLDEIYAENITRYYSKLDGSRILFKIRKGFLLL